jgi:hypothetical protein
MLPVENLDGEDVELEYFLVPGGGPLLLGNSLLHKSAVDGPDARGLRVVTPTYFDPHFAQGSLLLQLEVTFSNNSKQRGALT